MLRWTLVALVACRGGEGANGKNGAQGSVGATGPAGPAGPPGTSAGYRWVDVGGTPVTPGSEAVYVDGAGHMWPLDLETGEVVVSATFARGYYAESDCRGDEYVAGLSLPRLVMLNDQFDGVERYYVRPDDVSLTPETHIASIDVGTGCANTDAQYPAALFGALLEVQLPAVTWTAPLHPEVVE